MKRLLCLATMLFFAAPLIAAPTLTVAQSPADPRCIVLSWNPNSEADLAGYKVYMGKVAGVYGSPVSLTLSDAKHPAPTWTSPPLANGTWYFAVTAYNAAGLESGYSNEVNKVLQFAPAPPTGLEIKQQVAAILRWLADIATADLAKIP